MRVVITGAGSFVAYHLAEKLLKDGHEVLGIDRERSRNIEELQSDKKFTFEETDIAEGGSLSGLCRGADVIYHLAAVSSERLCREEPVVSLEVNLLGTLRMLEAAKDNKSLFVFSSSASVYPASDNPKIEEEADFTDGFYGTSKLLAEKYCRLYQKNFSLDCVILRFCRIYGPRMKRNPVYDMSRGLASGQPVKLYESLSSKYDFIYVLDVVKAFYLAMNKEWKNKTVNISSQTLTALSEVYEIMAGLSNGWQEIEVVNDKKSIDVVSNRRALTLGWKPKYSIKEGLAQTLSYFKEVEITP